jgi:hypothetical protein
MEHNKILLTNGKAAIVDAEDYDRLVGMGNWHYQNGYASKWSAGGSEARKKIAMHRFILCAPMGVDTDHINGNKLDNRKCNLRIATRMQNLQNSTAYKDRAFKGITKANGGKLWMARIKIPFHKQVSLGNFKTPEEAARAYDEAAKKHFGEFARLNFQE